MRKIILLLAALLIVPPSQPQAPEGVRVLKDLEYARVGDKRLLLDLYLPEKAEGPLPVIVSIHGGGWASGSKERSPGIRFAARGYAVASIGYRLSGEAVFPAQIEDCKAAVRWLRANAAKYQLDPRRFAAWGASAGGHLAALLGTSGEGDSRVQAVVDFFGPTDFLRMDAAAARPGAPPSRIRHDAPNSPESRLIGGPIQENKDKVQRANPITYVSPDDPPFLIMHGDRDPLVPLEQSRLLHEALQKAGVESTFHIVEGAGHGFGGAEIDAMVEAFLKKHLVPREPIAWKDPDASEPPGMRYRTFESPTAGTAVSYLVYLPPDYDKEGARRYPAIYWLHGAGGNPRGAAVFVRRLDAAIREGKAPPIIVIAVNGLRRSMYCDSFDGSARVERVTIEDLIPHVDHTYRTIARPEARAVEGFSMGGFGVLHLGFKYPRLFTSLSSISGALHDGDSLARMRPQIFQEVFGGRRDYFDANSPWQLVEKNASDIRNRMRVRVVVGDRDQLLERNRSFHELLERLEIPHDFIVVPGAAHNPGQVYEGLGDRATAFYATAFAAQSALAWDAFTVRTADGVATPALLAAPEGPGPFPVVVFFHGAPGGVGEEGLRKSAESERWQEFIQRGYAVCLADYRGHPKGQPFAVFRGEITAADDAIAILRHLRSLPRIDGARIAVIGGSLGGAVTLEMMRRERITCAVLNAPASFPFLGYRGGKGDAGRELSDDEIDKPAALSRIRDIRDPILMVQGTADGLTPLNKKLHALLKEAGKEARLELFEGEDHGFTNRPGGESYRRALEVTLEFMARHLAGK